MTSTEIFVIVVALFLGYKITASFIGKPKQARNTLAPINIRRPWHEVLNVAPDATREQIVDAYRRLIREFHPDRVVNQGKAARDEAEQRAAEINVAYDEALRQVA
nr:J domain-containing protein [Bacillus sp. NP157]